MRLELTAREVEVLDALLEAGARERQHQIHHALSRDYRKRLEAEADLLESLRTKLASTSDVG